MRKSGTGKLKTYQDYLKMRQDMLAKGYKLIDEMSEQSFNMYYSRVRSAKRTGEIKSQPWQYLKSKQKLISKNQAKIFAKAENNRRLELYSLETETYQRRMEEYKEFKSAGITIDKPVKPKKPKLTTTLDTYKFDKTKLLFLGEFINRTKSTGIYGGDYE